MAKFDKLYSIYLVEELEIIKERISSLKRQMRHSDVDHTEEIKDLQAWQRKIRETLKL